MVKKEYEGLNVVKKSYYDFFTCRDLFNFAVDFEYRVTTFIREKDTLKPTYEEKFPSNRCCRRNAIGVIITLQLQ